MDEQLLLPKSLSHYGQANFKDILKDELVQNAAKLPLGNFCNSGGLPDDESLEVSVTIIKEREQKVQIKVECFFDEAIPTGCSDCPITEPAMGEVSIVLDFQNNMAYLGEIEDETPKEESGVLPLEFS